MTDECNWDGCHEKRERRSSGRFYYYCEEHRKADQKRSREKHAMLRSNFLELYGGKCNCCGIDIPEFLSLDHIHGGGTKHRRSRGLWGVYRDAVKDYQPNEYQILCHNCNQAKGSYGICPHRKANP